MANPSIIRAVEDKLTRLKTDHLHLRQAYRDNLTPPEEQPLQGYATLIQADKIRYIYASYLPLERMVASLET
jgi:aryl-alcohol dehydrogenase-like predicted oxidoreductase